MKSAPNILMIIHQFRPMPQGGAEMQAERLAEKLAGRGHQIRILTQARTPGALSHEEYRGFHIYRAPFALGYGIWRGWWNQFLFLMRFHKRFDILHCHLAFGHAVTAIIAARILGKACIVKIGCAGKFGDLQTFANVEKVSPWLRILRQADGVIAISREIERELLAYGFAPNRVFMIPNGIDTDLFRRQKPWQNHSTWKCLLVGRRHPQKGVNTALKAFAFLKAHRTDLHPELHLHGYDYPEHDYRSMMSNLGLEDRVFFHDFQSEMRELLQEAQLFLLPSRGEGLSNALLEALSMEVPVIATRVSGNLDLIKNGYNGWLIPPNDSDALAGALQDAMDHPETAERRGQRGRDIVTSCYSLDGVAAQYEQLYARLRPA